MKKKNIIIIAGTIVLIGGIVFTSLVLGRAQSKNLSKDYKSQVDSIDNLDSQISQDFQENYWNFSTDLLKRSKEENTNTMISPLSIEIALAMVANGAEGDTKTQMETVLGGTKVRKINEYLKDFVEGLEDTENGKMKVANSIWINEKGGLEVNPEFLQNNANYFDSDVFKSPFTNSTVSEINKWTNENTKGTIKEILNEIDKTVKLILVNTVFFKQDWEVPYEDMSVSKEDFTNIKGEKEQVDMMFSGESTYLEDEDSIGYIKSYAENRYQLAVVLPKDEKNFKNYLDSFTGEKFASLIANASSTEVYASLPKLKSETSLSLAEPLKGMGMVDPFDKKKADFGKITVEDNKQLSISKVLHKTYISFTEKGTTAGAVTAVLLESGTAHIEDIKEVYLNRPFIYAILDSRTGLPVFIGVIETVEE